jgi:uncharacterized cupin superfamily protein
MKILIEKPEQRKLDELGIDSWSSWDCDPSVFDWEYAEEEVAYVYKGKVKVTTEFEVVEIKGGDLVVFPKGLKCKWEVIERIEKVFMFR